MTASGRWCRTTPGSSDTTLGMEWAEGPVYFAEGDYLLWSDIPNDRIMRYSDADGVSVFRSPCGYTNGHYRDLQGRLVSCEHGGRRVSRTESDGTVVTLAGQLRGQEAEFAQRPRCEVGWLYLVHRSALRDSE